MSGETLKYMTLRDGSLLCDTCGRTTHNMEDIYFRYCPGCGLLGNPVRQKWKDSRALLRELCDAFGRYKKVMDSRGDAYRVPTETILTEGIEEDRLRFCFPDWVDPPIDPGPEPEQMTLDGTNRDG